MSNSKFLFDRVKQTATKAITAERNGDLKTAFELFLQSAELLNQLIAIERSQRIRDSYYVKAKEYITRAKEIKILMDGPKTPADLEDDLPSIKSAPKSKPPKPSTDSKPKTTPPPPPPPKDTPKTTLPPPPKEKSTPPLPPPPEDLTKKMMRGEDEDDTPSVTPPPKKTTPKPPPKKSSPPPKQPQKKIELPSKTTFELLYDEGKYRECFIECGKSVEAELRVRMGMFDEQLTLGMLINRALKKGMEVLNDFKFVNIILNRIEHENYRPKQQEALRAINITNKILMS